MRPIPVLTPADVFDLVVSVSSYEESLILLPANDDAEW
jgi:hypothetical protein